MTRASPAYAIALLALLASACQPVVPSAVPPHQPMVVSSASLFGTWELVSVDGIAVPPKGLTITFERGGAFTATVDCNRAQGTYSYGGAELFVHGWQSTERGCVPPLPNEEFIVGAIAGKTFAVAFTSSSEMHLSGRHRLILRRM